MEQEQNVPQASTYDVIVVGGGPSGSTAAALTAERGHRVLLLDREIFPRFRIGESLMPATYWTFQRLGLLDKLRASRFPRKHSVQFYSESGRAGAPFYFSDVDPADSSATWQVDRMEFDRMLLDNAAEKGAEVRQGIVARDVLFEGDRAVGVRAGLPDGSTRDLRSKVVVDASGQTAMLSRKLKLKRSDPKLKHAAYHTRFEGARRDSGVDEGATVIFWTRDRNSWIWYIPLPDDQVSLGVVGHIDHLIRGRDGDPQKVFDEEIGRCPALQPRIENARQTGPVGVLRDFSYVASRIAGDGWVLAGDAFGFLDPIYSTGVFLALKSGELAADSVHAALESGDCSAESLGRHGEGYLAAMEAMRKLVYAYYDRSFSFADFLKQHPEHKEPLVHLLMGNVFRHNVDGLMASLGRTIELPEARSAQSLER